MGALSGLYFEILAVVVVKFMASPRGVWVGDCVRLWPSHDIRPFALAALEGINDGSLIFGVRNNCSHSSHNFTLAAVCRRVTAASTCGCDINSAKILQFCWSVWSGSADGNAKRADYRPLGLVLADSDQQ